MFNYNVNNYDAVTFVLREVSLQTETHPVSVLNLKHAMEKSITSVSSDVIHHRQNPTEKYKVIIFQGYASKRSPPSQQLQTAGTTSNRFATAGVALASILSDKTLQWGKGGLTELTT